MIWFWVRVYLLPVPVLMLEDVGVFGAIRRAFRLTRRQFWRTFGIALLTAHRGRRSPATSWPCPISLLGQVGLFVGGRYALLIYVGSQALAQVVTRRVRHPVHVRR